MKHLIALLGAAPLLVAVPASAYPADVYVYAGAHGVQAQACTVATGCLGHTEKSVSQRLADVSLSTGIYCPIAQPGPGGWPLDCRPVFTGTVSPRCPVGPLTLCADSVTVDPNDLVSIPQDPIPALVERVSVVAERVLQEVPGCDPRAGC